MLTEVSELVREEKLPDARAKAEEALSVAEQEFGPDDIVVASCSTWLGMVLSAMGDRKGAKPHYVRALRISEAALGEGAPEIAPCLANLAVLLQETADLAEAKSLWERALAIAGARQFMLSLWKVPDAETSELMDAFYKGLWEDGLPAEEALRRAQLAMLARDREEGVFRPSTWGAWVLTR